MTGAWAEVLAELPAAPEPPPGRIVVLSAHPDDEVLAVGAWLAGREGRDLVFVTATDGEASHPDSTTMTPADLRAQRPGELVEALSRLGIDGARVERLGLADGRLADDPDGLARAIDPWLAGAGLVLAPFESDGHPDHDAVGSAALRVCPAGVPVWRFPIWTWAWTEPDQQAWLSKAARLVSAVDTRALKRDAIEAFTSQVRPLSGHPADAAVVSGAMLAHARYCPEVVVT